MPYGGSQHRRSTRGKNVAKDHLGRKASRTRRLSSAGAMRHRRDFGQKGYAPVVPSPLGRQSCSIDSVPTPPPSRNSTPSTPPLSPFPPLPPPPPELPPSHDALGWEAWYRGAQTGDEQTDSAEDDICRSIAELFQDTEPDDDPACRGTCKPLVPIGSHRSASGSSVSHDWRFAEFEAAAAVYASSIARQAPSMLRPIPPIPRPAPRPTFNPYRVTKPSVPGMRRRVALQDHEQMYVDPRKVLLSSSEPQPGPASGGGPSQRRGPSRRLDAMDPQWKRPKGPRRG